MTKIYIFDSEKFFGVFFIIASIVAAIAVLFLISQPQVWRTGRLLQNFVNSVLFFSLPGLFLSVGLESLGLKGNYIKTVAMFWMFPSLAICIMIGIAYKL